MDLPSNILLSRITPKHLYLDKKSQEQSTNKIKPKYKLAGNVILEQYFFNILTRNLSACKKYLTLCIEADKWEDKAPESKLLTSYCDLTKFELMNKAILINKMRDRENGFPYMAKLCEQKYSELRKLRQKIRKIPSISATTRNIVKQGIPPALNKVLTKLGLN